MSARIPVPPAQDLHRRFVEQGWTKKRIAAYYRVSTDTVSRWLDEKGVARPVYESENLPRRAVVRYEEAVYDVTRDGRELTRTRAVLECGHHVPVTRANEPNKYHYRAVKLCRACSTENAQNGV